MPTNTRGTLRRSSPRSRSGTLVVAAIRIVAVTPSVAFTMMFHAAHSPTTESDTPRTSTRSPWPTIGINAAKARNGISMTSRRPTKPNGTCPTRRKAEEDQREERERPHGFTWRRDDREDEEHCRRDLALGSESVQWGRSREIKLIVAPAHVVAGSRLRAARTSMSAPYPNANVTVTPMTPASPVLSLALSTPSTP